MKCLAVLVILLFAALPACADSITFHTFAVQESPLRLEPLGPDLDPILLQSSFTVGSEAWFSTLR